MKIRTLISESLGIGTDNLPLQNPLQNPMMQTMQALKLYSIRLTIFLFVICANLVVLGFVVVIQNLELAKLVWFVLTLLLLVLLQRILHREIQAEFLIATRNPRLTVGLFSILFFPGVFLHELSHFVTAKILRVRTGKFSLLPKSLPDGRPQMGYVETAQTDIVRDSLIGMAPLIVGSLFVAFAAIYKMQLLPLWNLFLTAQWDAFWVALKAVLALPYFGLWFYLVFTVSSTMMPSESDRHAWLPLGLWVGILLVLAVFVSIGTRTMENLAPSIYSFLTALALTFLLSGIIHAILILPSMLFHRILSRLTGVDVKK
jgi:hypothetical protein